MALYTTVALTGKKTEGLRQKKGNFSGKILLNDTSREDLKWWITNLPLSSKAISHGEADIIIQTDASSQGWGGVHGEKRAGGRWTPTEASNRINYLELLAIFLSLKALCSAYTGSHKQVQCDNTTAVCYINNIGGSKSTPCNAITNKSGPYTLHRIIGSVLLTYPDVRM